MRGERAWFALLDAPVEGASASAEVTEMASGEPAGWMAAWVQSNKPVREALRADPAAFDPDGPEAVASLIMLPPEREVIFDDPAVQRARQLIHAFGAPWTAVTTLVSDPVHFRGSLLACPDGSWDPFGEIADPRYLRVGPGLLSAGPLRLAAPVIERYAGKPWPQTGF